MIDKFEISAMVRFFPLYCLIIMLGLLSHIPAGFAATRVLILGDSISASYGMKQKEGWVTLLQKRLDQEKQDIKLINASISGETTAGGLARFDKILANHKPDVVIIELGGNDGMRGFPVKKVKQNLLQIIEKSQQKNLLTSLMQISIPPNFGPRYRKMFENIYPQLSQQTDIVLLPFFMQVISIKPELIQGDGLHPNKTAQPVIRDFMYQEILKLLGDKID